MPVETSPDFSPQDARLNRQDTEQLCSHLRGAFHSSGLFPGPSLLHRLWRSRPCYPSDSGVKHQPSFLGHTLFSVLPQGSGPSCPHPCPQHLS